MYILLLNAENIVVNKTCKPKEIFIYESNRYSPPHR